MGDDAALMQTIHLANIACGFHASDFSIMDATVRLAAQHGVLIGAHPSLPDRQGFGRREMAIEPIKPHGAVYGQTARDPALARAVVAVARAFSRFRPEEPPVAFMGLAGTEHQKAAVKLGVPFIAEWFADLEYSPVGKLLITKTHDPVLLETIKQRVTILLSARQITTTSGLIPLVDGVNEVSICVHSDTPDAPNIARVVKTLVDESNARGGQ
ncbi:hypothetical protein EWM64_g5489 [Hericium alpestre]|uniref:Lactam utilization protein LamB n=1 Tax=Hericium alpestre TaxID=135208 RepID=A0A4Y9ZX83_9AGAM|nr:hypothetical protein EWM64_g5489 [Hericium alpestre]